MIFLLNPFSVVLISIIDEFLYNIRFSHHTSAMASNKIESLIKQITYQSCEMNGHETEPLSRICIDK